MKRAAAIAAWIAFLVTLVAAIGWGAHAPHSWDVDNIAPGSVLRGLAARFGPGWYSSYGPVPYLLLGLLYAPMLIVYRVLGELGVPAPEFPWGFRHPEVSIGVLIYAARLLCVALAAGVAWLAVRERWSGTSRDAWLPPLLLAGSPTFVYYARTSNVDMFYLFFLALAFHLAGRANGWRVRVGAAAAAALAICCKEQSAPLAMVAALAAAWHGEGGPSARVRRLGMIGLAAAAAYAVAWGLPFNASGWSAHHRFLFEQARYPRDYPVTLAGFLALGGNALRLLPVTFGWPILAGAAFAMFGRGQWDRLGFRALGQLLYAVGFLAVIGYVYPRFLLPASLLLLPLAIRGWSVALDRPGGLPAVLFTVLVAFTLLGGPLLGYAQIRDSRYVAGEWLGRHLSARVSPTVEVVGNPRFQARIPRDIPARSTYPDSLRRAPRAPEADVVLMSSFDSYQVQSDPVLRSIWWEPLNDTAGAYRLALDLSPPRWSVPIRGLPVSPAVWIWVRKDVGVPRDPHRP